MLGIESGLIVAASRRWFIRKALSFKPFFPRRPHTTGPKPHQLKTPTPKTPSEQKARKNCKEYRPSFGLLMIMHLIGDYIALLLFNYYCDYRHSPEKKDK